jgi:hypothetical protein
MAKAKPPDFLRVVEAPAERPRIDDTQFELPAWRRTLFSSAQANLMLFLRFDDVGEAEFLTILLSVRPKYIFDLRLAARFDLGSLNRSAVFSLFKQIEAGYSDLAGKFDVRSSKDVNINPAHLANHLRTVVFANKPNVEGPILFLTSGIEHDAVYQGRLAEALGSLTASGWDLFLLPETKRTVHSPNARNVIFISHAAPQDNDFAIWLGSHLSLLGYLVWSDVAKLKGGDYFWDNIEEVIRERAARVVVCLSKVAQTKNGVLDEISLGIATERAQNLNNFVVPIIIDDLAFGDVRANLARKHIIDFSANWADGLKELAASLERDEVPRGNGDDLPSKTFATQLRSPAASVVLQKAEEIYANWFAINSWPAHVTFVEFDGPVHDVEKIRQHIPIPTFSFLRLVGAFASVEELQASLPPDVVLRVRCIVSFDEFISGRVTELPGLTARFARDKMTYMCRMAWDRKAAAKGLLPYVTSNNQTAWFPPVGLIPDGVVQFVGPENVRRRKTLVGRSDKRRVNWHFAVQALPNLYFPSRMILKPHVVFSEDGANLVASSTKMHSLRRGFCRSWWNDRWRDLIASYVAWFSDFESEVKLPLSELSELRISSRMMQWTSPVSLSSTKEILESASNVEWLEDPDLDEFELSDMGNADSDDTDK